MASVDATRTQYVATLDRFATHTATTPGLQLSTLEPMTTLVVRTRNTSYRVLVSDGEAGLVRVQGGTFFPSPTVAHLEGATLGGSFLKVGWIGIGLSMELRVGEQRIVTSPVQGIDHQSASSSVH
jgi:hypothetical protein